MLYFDKPETELHDFLSFFVDFYKVSFLYPSDQIQTAVFFLNTVSYSSIQFQSSRKEDALKKNAVLFGLKEIKM